MRLVVCLSMVAIFLRSTKAFIVSPTTRRIRTSIMVLDDSVLKYWNQSNRRNYQTAITREAKIISLSSPDDDANSRLHHGSLPEGATLLAIGTKLDDFDLDELTKAQPNVIFVSHPKVNATVINIFVVLLCASSFPPLYRLASHWLNCSRHSLAWNGYTHDRQELTFAHQTVYPIVRHM